MTAIFINKIVGLSDGVQYPLQEIETAIPASDAELEYTRAQVRLLPQQVKAHMFAMHTMATWFQLTGVGTPTEKIQDEYTLDQTKAIEISCEQKLREYQVGIPRGMTARAALMAHIFKVAIRNSTPERKIEIIQAMNQCSTVSHVRSLTSRFCSMAITALKIAKWVAESQVFQILIIVFLVSFIYLQWILLGGRLLDKMFNHFGRITLIPAFCVGWYLPDFTRAISKTCVKAIESLSRFAHKRAKIAHENYQLKRAYVTWMNETSGLKIRET